MLIIISDIHLGDGTCGKSISASAFHLFSDRLRELARSASFRADGTYAPISEIDVLLLGDIFEVQHSTFWLEKSAGEPGAVRPWSDPQSPAFAAKIQEITAAILENNRESVDSLHALTHSGGLTLPPATNAGLPDDDSPGRVSVQVRLHYMVGNHDWFYHLPGAAFDQVRAGIISAMGLSNPALRFPHDINEQGAEWLKDLLGRYSVFARHGDIHDGFNFSKHRDQASFGDVFAVEVLNRFVLEASRKFAGILPASLIAALSELVNVRPALAAPLWISSQMRQNNVPVEHSEALKELWDGICRDFLELEPIRAADTKRKMDLVDWFKLGIRVTDRLSFKSLDEIILWVRGRLWSDDEIKFSSYALKEAAFREEAANFIVYGHTHHHEVVPLDDIPSVPLPTSQLYINSGTWHTYFDLAIFKPEEQKFIPYQVLTYLAFFHDDERRGRRFEAWSGAFSE